MLLAIIPNFFAWRSLPSYFYCAAYPLFVLMAARMQPRVRIEAQARTAYHTLPAISARPLRGLGQPAWRSVIAAPLAFEHPKAVRQAKVGETGV